MEYDDRVQRSEGLSEAIGRAFDRLSAAEREHLAIEISDAVRRSADANEITQVALKWQVSSMVKRSIDFQQQSNQYLRMRIEGEISEAVTEAEHASLIQELRSLA